MRSLTVRSIFMMGLCGVLAGCDKAPEHPADVIYFGGPILTMAGDTPDYAEALAVRAGRIQAVGGIPEVEATRGEGTRVVNLGGKALLPGFIDAHGHVANVGMQALAANLLPPPDGEGHSIDSLVALLKEWQARGNSLYRAAGWIIGFGYDDSQLVEQRHPTAHELDRVSTDEPVLIIHQSGHVGAVNSKALAMLNMSMATPDPEGGVIRRQADGRTPSGVLEEMALFIPLMKVLSFGDEMTQEMALAGIDAYTRFGFTTAQEGRADPRSAETWRTLANAGRLAIDVAVYPDIGMSEQYMLKHGTSRVYENRFRLAGVKLSFDGSPQARTAWLSQPYFHAPHGFPENYAGYPAIPDEAERLRQVTLAFRQGWQLLVHCNGDAASDAMIADVSAASELFGNADRRTVMIHAQTVREDQLDAMKSLGIIPSFFSMHTFYWGDWHRDVTLGPARAMRISPTQSALKRGMRFTEHHDAPVALPSAIMILHTTVNRTSRSNALIGEDQKVSPYIALKSLTEWAAWQYFEEDRKGTLAPGLLADFVILDADPLAVAPQSLKDLKVIETIKEGQTVYRADIVEQRTPSTETQ